MMPCRASSLLPIVALSGSLVACASGSSIGTLAPYIAVGYTNVQTSCGGGYQVYRKPGEPKILVRAYEVAEVRRSLCESIRSDPPRVATTGVRYEDAALEYLATTPDLKACTLASGVEITRVHSEFVLACPAAPAAAISVKG
jgi:hypothetical protein